MKLEVGMYIRTDKGFIAKVKEFKHDYTKGKRLVDDYSVKEVVENYLLLDGNQCRLIESIDYSIPPCYPSDEELDEIKSHILKASYNIIDILEVGDIITTNNLCGEITKIDRDKIYTTCYDGEYCYVDDIKSVVTKEQFEEMSYKIKESR